MAAAGPRVPQVRRGVGRAQAEPGGPKAPYSFPSPFCLYLFFRRAWRRRCRARRCGVARGLSGEGRGEGPAGRGVGGRGAAGCGWGGGRSAGQASQCAVSRVRQPTVGRPPGAPPCRPGQRGCSVPPTPGSGSCPRRPAPLASGGPHLRETPRPRGGRRPLGQVPTWGWSVREGAAPARPLLLPAAQRVSTQDRFCLAAGR